MQTTINRPVNFYLKTALKAYRASDAPGHAFLIKAPWGTGKTFFINTELPPTKATGSKKRVLHFSLNGCADMSEFRKRLLRALVPSLKTPRNNELVKQWLDIIKDKLGIDPTIFAAQSSVCYVIDDLERCRMPLDETMGAINELVEQLQCHVIILAIRHEILLVVPTIKR